MKGNQPSQFNDLGPTTPCYICSQFDCICAKTTVEFSQTKSQTKIPTIQNGEAAQKMTFVHGDVMVTIKILPTEQPPQDPPKSRQDCIRDLVSGLESVSERINHLWTGTEHEYDTQRTCLMLDAAIVQLRCLAKLEDLTNADR